MSSEYREIQSKLIQICCSLSLASKLMVYHISLLMVLQGKIVWVIFGTFWKDFLKNFLTKNYVLNEHCNKIKDLVY